MWRWRNSRILVNSGWGLWQVKQAQQWKGPTSGLHFMFCLWRWQEKFTCENNFRLQDNENVKDLDLVQLGNICSRMPTMRYTHMVSSEQWRTTTYYSLWLWQIIKSSQSPFPHPMTHRAAPTSVSLALGHASANAVKATAGGWSTGSSTSLNFPLHSHM